MQSRAQEFIAKRNKEFEEKSKSLGIDEKLQQLPGLDQDMLLTLASSGVKTIDDLADLATDELIEMLGENILSVQEANKVIMAAVSIGSLRNSLRGGQERFCPVMRKLLDFSSAKPSLSAIAKQFLKEGNRNEGH